MNKAVFKILWSKACKPEKLLFQRYFVCHITVAASYRKQCITHWSSVPVILASEDNRSIRLTGLTALSGRPLATHDWLASISINDCMSVTRSVSSGGRLYAYVALAVCPGRSIIEKQPMQDYFNRPVRLIFTKVIMHQEKLVLFLHFKKPLSFIQMNRQLWKWIPKISA